MARTSRYQDVKNDILDRIGGASLAHGRPPAVRDLSEQFSVSVSTMHSFLQKMQEEGLVEWRPGKHRSLQLTQSGFRASSLQVP